MADTTSGDMMEKAQHIWNMLENMAQSDPAAYRRFIDKNMKEGREFMEPPQPCMCVHVSKMRDSDASLYINICSWHRVPAPEGDAPIPISGGPLYKVKDEERIVEAIPVAFNPKILEECGPDATSLEEQDMLIQLCLDYIEKEYKIRIHRSYTLLPKKVTHKGTFEDLRKALTVKTKPVDEKFEEELGELEKTFGFGLKDSVMSEMANISSGERPKQPGMDSSVSLPTSAERGHEVKLLPKHERQPPKKGLIQEIRDSGGQHASDLPEPEYDLQIREATDSAGRSVSLRILLPEVNSVEECELDISKEDVHLEVESQCRLHLKWPEAVDVSMATAKFSRRTHTLIVKMPVINDGS